MNKVIRHKGCEAAFERLAEDLEEYKKFVQSAEFEGWQIGEDVDLSGFDREKLDSLIDILEEANGEL